MKQTSATRTLKFIEKATTYMAYMVSPSGDLYLEYEGEGSDISVVPDEYFRGENDEGCVFLVCVSSRHGFVLPSEGSFKVFCNNQEILFDESGLSIDSGGGWAEIFLLTTRNTGTGDIAHKGVFIANPVRLAKNVNYQSVVIRMVAEVGSGNTKDTIESSYSIPIQKASGSTYRVTIASADDNYFTIRSNGDTCKLKGVVYLKGTEITDGITFKWYRVENGVKGAVIGQGSEITVSEEDIVAYAEYMVEAYKGGNLIGTDVQGVTDITEPIEINPNPNPVGESIKEGTEETVTYTPFLFSMENPTEELSGITPTWTFKVLNSAGQEYDGVEYINNKNTSPFVVTHTMCAWAQGDVAVDITANW